jgi:hypothetical protein
VTEPWNLESLVIQDSILVCSPDPRIPHTADVGEITCKRRFRSLFGISTRICVLIWTLLSKQLGCEARPVHLHWTLFFLKHYSVEEVNAAFAGVNEKTYRKWTWLMLEELAKLNLVSATVLLVVPGEMV